MNFLFSNSYNNLKLSFSIVAFALVLVLINRNISSYLKLAAMVVSFLADMVMAGYKPFCNLIGGGGFYIGGSMFMLAHILYIAAFLLIIKKSGYTLVNTGFYTGLGVTAVFGIALVILFFLNKQTKIPMLLFAVLYTLVIGAVCVAVCSYAFSKKGVSYINVIGIISFIISDFLIGINVVGNISFASRDAWIWVFYPLGQILILISTESVSS